MQHSGNQLEKIGMSLIRGYVDQSQATPKREEDEDVDQGAAFIKYLRQYVPSINSENIVEGEKESDDRHIIFDSVKQARKFADRFAHLSSAEIHQDEPIVTINGEQFDRTVAVANFLQKMSSVMFDKNMRQKINHRVFFQTEHLEEGEVEPFTDKEREKHAGAMNATVRFLYTTFIEQSDSTLTPDERFQQATNFFNSLSEQCKRLSDELSGQRLSEENWYLAFEQHVLSEFEALTRLHYRLVNDQHVKDFRIQIPDVEKDLNEATDCVVGVEYSDGQTAQIRYQIKQHTLEQGQDTLKMRRGKELVEQPVPPEFAGKKEVIFDPARQERLTIVDLDTFQVQEVPSEMQGRFLSRLRMYVYNIHAGHSWDRLWKKVKRDADENANLLPNDPQFNKPDTQHLAGWIMLHQERKIN